jgi:hypothetical protein
MESHINNYCSVAIKQLVAAIQGHLRGLVIHETGSHTARHLIDRIFQFFDDPLI